MADSFREEMKTRTLHFSVRVIRLFSSIKHNNEESSIIGKQLLRAATSVGANYREACHGRSRADFTAKLKICEAEAAEAVYWMEVLECSQLVSPAKIAPLRREAEELTAILRTSSKKLSKGDE